MKTRIKSSSRLVRGLGVLLVLMLVIGAANLIVTGRDVNSLASRTQTVCSFFGDIGTAPVVQETNGQKHTSKLGVTIVVDARTAWYGLNCPGHLAPASVSLTYWARHYHVRLPMEDVAVGQG